MSGYAVCDMAGVPVACFMYSKDATAWAHQTYPNGNYKIGYLKVPDATYAGR